MIVYRSRDRTNWPGFISDCHRRMSLPTCQEGVSTMASAKLFLNTIRPFPIHDMSVCEACFLDRAGWQEDIATRFAPLSLHPTQITQRFTCDFQPAPMIACSNSLLAYGMFDRWHQMASKIMSKPTCSSEGITNGEWYGLPDPTNPSRNVENFEICGACHAGWNESVEWAHIFRRIQYPPGTTRICDLNASSPRYAKYVEKWTEMYLTGDPASFIKYVSRCASLSTCQGTHRLENAGWYGNEDAGLLICPSCFEEAVRDTPLAAAFPLQNVHLPTERHCSLYSARMRKKYMEACEQRTLTPLLQFATHREQIYQQTIPSLEAFHARQQEQIRLLKTANQVRSQSTQITAMGRAFMGGPPIVHAFDPAVVSQTIGISHMRRTIANDPQRPQMLQLEALWKEVE